MTKKIRRRRPKRIASSLPIMLAHTPNRVMTVATIVGLSTPTAASCLACVNTSRATTQERIPNSSQLWTA